MKSPFRKNQKLQWTGQTYALEIEDDPCTHFHFWPPQEVTVLSTNGDMSLIRCFVHFTPESGVKHPARRERLVFNETLSRI